MADKHQSLGDARRTNLNANQTAPGSGAQSSGSLAELEAQLNSRDKKIAQLEQELAQALCRDKEAAQKVDLLEREKAEILTVLENTNRSFVWKLVKRYRRLKSSFLPPGSLRRGIYDKLIRLNSPAASATFQSPLQRSTLTDAGTPSAPADDFYPARLELLSAPNLLGAGDVGTAKLAITNLSNHTWKMTSSELTCREDIRLSYQWYDDAGKAVQWDAERTNLPQNLSPQDSVWVELRVFAPFAPGSYTLEISLVQDGITSDQEGAANVRVPVRVGSSHQQFPSCSIVIPVFNRALFTKACLLALERSVAAERVPHEVIVVDNGSSDETPDLLSVWSQSRSNARAVRMEHNFGFARACNEGARLARGRYIVLLNNDTLPTPGWLERMLSLAANEPQAGVVGSKLLFPNGRIQHVGVAFDEHMNPAHIFRGFPSNIPAARTSREYQAVTGACLLVDRDLYWSVGGLDESYENSCEDVDLCLKIRARGYRVIVCADSVVYHFESLSEERHAGDFRNRALLKARWETTIDRDMKRRYKQDRLRDESAEFEAHAGYDGKQEKLLRTLWKRIYLSAFPDDGLSSRK